MAGIGQNRNVPESDDSGIDSNGSEGSDIVNRLNGWNINDDIEFWNQYNNPQPQAAHLTQKALACKNCKAVLFKVNERLFEEADNILVFKIERTVTFDDGFRYVRYDSPAFSLGRGNVLGRGRGRGSGRVFMGSFERDGYYRQAELPGWRCANCSAELSNYIPTSTIIRLFESSKCCLSSQQVEEVMTTFEQ